MVEFNSDGSLKLPAGVLKAREENLERMKSQRCMKIRREVVNFSAPKKCVLKIQLSDAIHDARFIESIYGYFKDEAQTPTRIARISVREFDIEIGTDFRRCTDCASLRGKFREFLDGNLIDEKASCTFVGRIQSFHDEDYFE